MPRIRLFCPGLTEGVTVLSAEESHHADVAMRVRAGEEVSLFDGIGREGIGTVTRVDRRRLEVNVRQISQHAFESIFRITLAVAAPKAHRQGYLVEKCTELGVASIQPIVADHSVVRPGDALVDRWMRRAIEAAKQSRRAWIPTISSPIPFRAVLETARQFTATALTDSANDAASFAAFLQQHAPGASLLVLVGPEGGWSDTEREAAGKAGAISVSLSPTVLRTETAAAAVCAAVALASRAQAR